jgi:hypothetical protein
MMQPSDRIEEMIDLSLQDLIEAIQSASDSVKRCLVHSGKRGGVAIIEKTFSRFGFLLDEIQVSFLVE